MRNLFILTLYASFLLVFVSCSGDKKEDSSRSSARVESDTAATKKQEKTILFFGNSLTAGYGVELSEAFPGLIQKRLDSLNLPYKVVNAGVSGETTSSGNSRIDWVLRQPVDVFVLELGGNDGLRGIPLSETRKNLQSILDKVRAKYPDVKIILGGMQVPPNMGSAYTSEFRSLYPELARKNNVSLIPFLLEKVGGERKLNLPDGIHPTPEGHKIVAENVWAVLKEEV